MAFSCSLVPPGGMIGSPAHGLDNEFLGTIFWYKVFVKKFGVSRFMNRAAIFLPILLFFQARFHIASAQAVPEPSPYQKGLSLSQSRHFDQAEEAFLEAMKDVSTRLPAQYALARLYAEIGQWEKAENHLYQFLSARPRSADGFYLLGYTLYKRGQFTASIAALQESVTIKKENAGAHKVLGLNYYQLNKLDLAEQEWITAVQQKSDFTEAHYFLGRLYYTVNRINDALHAFETTIKVDPEFMKAYDNMGLALEALGRTDDAMKAYRRAIELNEQHQLQSKWPYLNLGELLLKRKRTAESVACLQKAVSLDPKSGKAHTYLGKAYLQQGKSDDALRSFQTAVQVDPGYAGGHYQLGLLYRVQGRNREAKEEMKLFEAYRDKHAGLPQILE
ncbi:MAG: hypothetical protein DMG05_26330 [Acidobacteria bacterium]|nr:MAG: hypothetical protein DMG05_26330 [Acidobacteriota bacterium]